ncbi:MAG: TM2 domain-containing protein [Leptospiraceae bacterium]|nr:TM2 domain-containing protein [Leptospiraceae bacterium]
MEQNESQVSEKSRETTLFTFFIGFHYFYLEQTKNAFLYLFSAGGFGLWFFYDLYRIISGKMKDKNGLLITKWYSELKILLKYYGIFFLIILITGAINSSKNERTNSPQITEKNQPATNVSPIDEPKENEPKEDDFYKVGDSIPLDILEVTVSKIEEKKFVGNEYFNEPASEGAILVCVQFKFKNNSNTPLSSYKKPKLELVDSKGTTYDPDIGKTINYSVESKVDTKILSKLNPGVSVKSVEVFEIGKDFWKVGHWYLKVEYDGVAKGLIIK